MSIRAKISRTRAVLGAALFFAAVVGLLLPPQHAARGQEIMRIAAVVNDEVISIYDLAARISIVVASSNLRDAPELRRQIAPQVLRTLVDEYLQTQEAARLDIAVTDRDVEFTIDRIEQGRGLGEGGFDNFVRTLAKLIRFREAYDLNVFPNVLNRANSLCKVTVARHEDGGIVCVFVCHA